jgi:hypothetical protein
MPPWPVRSELEITDCDFQVAPFLGGEVEHEVPGKAFQVSLDGLHQDSGLDLVERGQMSADMTFCFLMM